MNYADALRAFADLNRLNIRQDGPPKDAAELAHDQKILAGIDALLAGAEALDRDEPEPEGSKQGALRGEPPARDPLKNPQPGDIIRPRTFVALMILVLTRDADHTITWEILPKHRVPQISSCTLQEWVLHLAKGATVIPFNGELIP